MASGSFGAFGASPHGPGDDDDGPRGAEKYKRAVLRGAPSRFSIEFLPPTRTGSSGGYKFGMRISPISRGNRSPSSCASSFRTSLSDYEVWRRWEDCLWFQDSLEIEYERLARQKRQRLARGKGVKKNGFYLQDRASSWESLPPGPDPNSVARDIHEYVPKLTKRGTIFRASQGIVEQRNNELQAFVEALFKDDQPALIKEMRTTRLVTDFFGYWQRDADIDAKKRKSICNDTPISSSRSFFSHFSSASTVSLADVPSTTSPKSLPNTPNKRPFLRPRASSAADRPHSTAATYQPSRSRAASVVSSTMSSDSSSYTSDDHSSVKSAPVSDPRIVEEVPLVFGYDPQQLKQLKTRGHVDSMLDALPERHEEASVQKPDPIANKRRNRNAKLFITPPDDVSAAHSAPSSPTSFVSESTEVPTPHNRSIHDSWISIDSTLIYLEGLNITGPNSADDRRQSVATMNTFMTTDSADAVLPRTPTTSSLNRASLDHPRRSTIRASVPISLSDFDMYPEIPEEDIPDDTFPRPASVLPARQMSYSSEHPETPRIQSFVHDRKRRVDKQLPFNPPSPTFTASTRHSDSSVLTSSTVTASAISLTSSTKTRESMEDTNIISIKAVHNNAIILLRVDRDIEFKDLRQRILNKFIGQEGIPLSKTFIVAAVVSQSHPVTLPPPPKPEEISKNPLLASINDPDVGIIASHADWEVIAYTLEGSKLTLRIFDSSA